MWSSDAGEETGRLSSHISTLTQLTSLIMVDCLDDVEPGDDETVTVHQDTVVVAEASLEVKTATEKSSEEVLVVEVETTEMVEEEIVKEDSSESSRRSSGSATFTL